MADPTPGAGELVVQVTACGVCGSDLHARPAMPDGTIMGHEFCGEVVAVGPGAERAWREGSRVAVLPVLSCGECSWCRAGEVAHCRAARLIGLGGSPGGFAELAVVSSALAFEVPEELPDIYGALVEPFAVGLHTARAAGISTGDDVLIMGAGPVGLTTTRWAREMGARRIVVSDPAATRRRMSEDFGATAVVDPTVDELGHDFDVVIDCVGRPGLLDRAIDATRTKGRILVAGVCVEPDPYLPVLALLKELTIGFSVYYRPDEFEHVKGHTTLGERILAPFLGESPMVLRIVRSHHERMDGGGFPDGASGQAIPAEARIVAVVDAFDAMTTNRAYRKPRSPTEAMDELRSCARTHFDAEVVNAFERVFSDLTVLPPST